MVLEKPFVITKMGIRSIIEFTYHPNARIDIVPAYNLGSSNIDDVQVCAILIFGFLLETAYFPLLFFSFPVRKGNNHGMSSFLYFFWKLHIFLSSFFSFPVRKR